MEHSRGEDEEEEQEFPTFGYCESDYNTVGQPHILHSHSLHYIFLRFYSVLTVCYVYIAGRACVLWLLAELLYP